MPVTKGTLSDRKDPNGAITGISSSLRPAPPVGGACSGRTTNMWFPVVEGIGRGGETRNAMNLCHSCDIQVECLAYALEWEIYGIWGGMSERQRRQLRVKLRIPPKRADYQ